MPSNTQLIEEVSAVAKKLRLRVDTSSLNNAALAALLSDLKGQYNKRNNLGEEVPEPQTQEPINEVPTCFYYAVVKGKSITSRRGILSDGDEVLAEYFAGGNNVLVDLYERGYLEKITR